MKIQKINTGIIITKTAKQPSAKIEFSLDELDALSEFCERLQDEKDIREYLNTAVTIPDSAEVSAPIAAKYLRDAACLVSGKRTRCSWYPHRANIQSVQLFAL